MNLLRRDPTLNALNTTSFRIVVTMRIAVAVFTAALGAFAYEVVHGTHPSLAIDILDSTYLALCALAGINAAQYAAKRFSDSGYKAAGQAAQVTTTEGGPLTVQPGGAVQTQAGDTPPPANAETVSGGATEHESAKAIE